MPLSDHTLIPKSRIPLRSLKDTTVGFRRVVQIKIYKYDIKRLPEHIQWPQIAIDGPLFITMMNRTSEKPEGGYKTTVPLSQCTLTQTPREPLSPYDKLQFISSLYEHYNK